MNADGSNPHQVTTDVADGPAFTPDGRISYRASLSPSFEFRTVPSTGGPFAFLKTADGSHFPPRWTTSGSYVYAKAVNIPTTAEDSQQVFAVGSGGEIPLTLPTVGLTGNQQPSWSPDGSKVIYWRSNGSVDDLYVVPGGGGSETLVSTPSGINLDKALPSFSPDGSKIIWDQANTTDSANNFFHKNLVIANADGSGAALVPRPAAIDYASAPVWAPAGPSTPPPSPIASFDATGPKKVKKGKSISVSLKCTGDTQCVATYSAVVSVPRKGKKPKTFKIKSKTITLAAKESKTVKLTVPSGAKNSIKKALKAGKKPTVKIAAEARQPNNGPLIRKVTLTVKITS
jgi:hypothetical protein